MFPEFGQAPICLEFDLRTYEGPYYHVANFRGREGWLMAARGTIQNEHHLLSAKLIVACDEHENVILPFKAETLASCGWKNLTESALEPPELLDDLMCEQEGDLYARFQRMMNRDLAGMEERAQRQIEAIDARLKTLGRRLDRELSELRRRRLMSESPEERMALSNLMADIEADHDLAIADLTAERARQRRRADAAEEMLWEDTDALIEVEPLFTINWCAPHGRAFHFNNRTLLKAFAADAVRSANDYLAALERQKEFSARLKLKDQIALVEAEPTDEAPKPAPRSKGRDDKHALPPHANVARVNAITEEFAAALAASAEKKAAEAAKAAESEVSTPKAPIFGQEFIAKLKERDGRAEAAAIDDHQERETVETAPEDTPPPTPQPAQPQLPKLDPTALDELARLQTLRDKNQRGLERLEVRLASPNMAEAIRGPLRERRRHYISSIAELDAEMDAIRRGGPRPPLRQVPPMPKLPPAPSLSERNRLVQQLALVVQAGVKFRQGSPKFAANLAERKDLERRIAALVRQPEKQTAREEESPVASARPEPAAQAPAAPVATPPATTPATASAPSVVSALPSLRKIWLRKKANLDARVLDLEALEASHSPWTQPWFEVQDLLKKAQDELRLINKRLGVSSLPSPAAKPDKIHQPPQPEATAPKAASPTATLPTAQTDRRANLLRRKASIEAQIADLQEQEAKLPPWSKAWHAVRDRLAPLETELELTHEQLAKLPAAAEAKPVEPARVRELPTPNFGLSPAPEAQAPRPTPPIPEDLAQLITRRDALKQELRDHERGGTSVEDGPNRLNVYRSKRDKLMEQISRANMKIAAIERKAAVDGAPSVQRPSAAAAPFDWTSERQDYLKRHWKAGFAADRIAEELGTTRNVVMARVWRLGLPRRGQDSAGQDSAPQAQ